MRYPSPPKHLRDETQKWWKSLVKTYEFDSHHLKLLTLACEAWDRCQGARETMAALGSTTYADRFGQPKARPEVAIERDSAIVFARLVRELALDVEAPEGHVGRPPQIAPGSGRRVS